MGPGRRAEELRPPLGEVDVGLQAVMEPAADQVTGGPAAVNDFVVTAAPAQIARPAPAAGFVAIDHALGEPAPLRLSVHAAGNVAERTSRIVNKAMARE